MSKIKIRKYDSKSNIHVVFTLNYISHADTLSQNDQFLELRLKDKTLVGSKSRIPVTILTFSFGIECISFSFTIIDFDYSKRHTHFSKILFD